MISWAKVRDLLEGSKVILIAGGPSVELLEPWKFPEHNVVVVVNNGIYAYPFADILVTMDSNLHAEYIKNFDSILTDTGCPFISQPTYSGEYAFDILGHFNVKTLYCYGFDLIKYGIEGCGVDGDICKKNDIQKLTPEQKNNVMYSTMATIHKHRLNIKWM